MTERMFAWAMVAATVALTCYGQLVLKWQADLPLHPAGTWRGGLPPLLQLLLRPWVLSALAAAFAASLCWMLALARLELSRAYPFTALTFVIVTFSAVLVFGEPLSVHKLVGMALIVAGLVVLSQG